MKLATFLSGDIAYAFSWTMIHSFWQAGLIALVLALSLSINRNLSARVRYLHGIFALIMCVVASGATFSYLYKSIGEAHYIVQTSGVTIHYFGGFWEQTYGVLNNNIEYILAVWLIGFSVQFIRFTRDFVLALRLRHQNCSPVSGLWSQRCAQLAKRMGISKRIFIRNSSRVSSICVIGHLKPVILLPIGLLTSLDVEQVEALLLHELAHIQRNDYVVNAIQSFVRLLYFFNPAVLWISRNIDIERENACDDTAVKHCGSPTLYANSLANISELQLRLATVLAAKKTGENMLPRVKRLFSDSSGMAKSMEQFVSALIAGLLVVAMNASANDIRIPSFAAEPVTLPAQSQGSQDVVPAQQVTTNPAAETNMQHAPSANTLPTVVSGSIEGAETPDNALPTLTFSEDTHMELASPSLDFALKKQRANPFNLPLLNPLRISAIPTRSLFSRQWIHLILIVSI
jgi:Antirepressor regulating drug resistance, predicted signal transduction N-terminal membrane component